MPDLERSIDDIRAALDWAQETGRVERALLTTSALHFLWLTRAFLEGRERLDRLLAHASAAGVNAAVAQAGAVSRAQDAFISGDYELALALLDRAESYDPTFSGFVTELYLRLQRVRTYPHLGRRDEARAELGRLTAEARSAGDAGLEAEANNYLAVIAMGSGDLELAAIASARAIECAETSGLLLQLAHAHEVAAMHALLGGALDDARVHLVVTLGTIAELRHRICLAHTLENVCVWAFRVGNRDLGVETFDTAHAIRISLGVPSPWYESLLYREAQGHRAGAPNLRTVHDECAVTMTALDVLQSG